jgi:hypothetical protein
MVMFGGSGLYTILQVGRTCVAIVRFGNFTFNRFHL